MPVQTDLYINSFFLYINSYELIILFLQDEYIFVKKYRPT